MFHYEIYYLINSSLIFTSYIHYLKLTKFTVPFDTFSSPSYGISSHIENWSTMLEFYMLYNLCAKHAANRPQSGFWMYLKTLHPPLLSQVGNMQKEGKNIRIWVPFQTRPLNCLETSARNPWRGVDQFFSGSLWCWHPRWHTAALLARGSLVIKRRGLLFSDIPVNWRWAFLPRHV